MRVPRNLDYLFYNCPVLVEFLWFVVDSVWNLSVSLLLCVKVDFGCYQFVVQRWRIPLQNGYLLLSIAALHGIIILSLWIELIERSVVIIHSDSWIFCLIISPLVKLRLLVGLRPPSNSFIISFCLTLTTESLSDPVQNTTPEGILSKCWCSLILTLTTSMGIWDGAGAAKSWFLVLQLSCSPPLSFWLLFLPLRVRVSSSR